MKPPKFQRQEVKQQAILNNIREIWSKQYRTLGVFKLITQNLSLTLYVIMAYAIFATIGCLKGGYSSAWITIIPFGLIVLMVALAIFDRYTTINSIRKITKTVQKKYPAISQHEIVMICSKEA